MTSLFGEDVMVERMQSVVDEVTQLRAAYEESENSVKACDEKLARQSIALEKLSRSEGMDYKDFEKNRKEIEKLQAENKNLKNYKKEIETLEKENQRLTSSARILVDKNQELLAQVNKHKKSSNGEVEALEIELKTTLDLLAIKQAQINSLKKQLASRSKQNRQAKCPKCKACKKTKPRTVKSCKDDNPFPKLMPKDGKTINPHPVELEHVVKVSKIPQEKPAEKSVKSKQVVSEKASSYRMKNETAVYDAINGKVVAIWEVKTSFTSNIEQGEWVKITGYFVNKKWKKSTKSLWVRSKNTIKR